MKEIEYVVYYNNQLIDMIIATSKKEVSKYIKKNIKIKLNKER